MRVAPSAIITATNDILHRYSIVVAVECGNICHRREHNTLIGLFFLVFTRQMRRFYATSRLGFCVRSVSVLHMRIHSNICRRRQCYRVEAIVRAAIERCNEAITTSAMCKQSTTLKTITRASQSSHMPKRGNIEYVCITSWVAHKPCSVCKYAIVFVCYLFGVARGRGGIALFFPLLLLVFVSLPNKNNHVLSCISSSVGHFCAFPRCSSSSSVKGIKIRFAIRVGRCAEMYILFLILASTHRFDRRIRDYSIINTNRTFVHLMLK